MKGAWLGGGVGGEGVSPAGRPCPRARGKTALAAGGCVPNGVRALGRQSWAVLTWWSPSADPPGGFQCGCSDSLEKTHIQPRPGACMVSKDAKAEPVCPPLSPLPLPAAIGEPVFS